MCELIWQRWLAGAAFAMTLLFSAAGAPPLAVRVGENRQTVVHVHSTNRPFVLETSRAFSNWVVWRQVETTAQPMDFEDWVPSLYRFYRIREFDPPANDAFEKRSKLSGKEWSVQAPVFRATRQPAEPQHATLEDSARTIWFSWQAPADGVMTLDTAGSYLDTVVAVYEGDKLERLTRVAREPMHARAVRFRARAGVDYQICAGGLTTETGLIELHGSLGESANLNGLALNNFSVKLANQDRGQRELRVENGRWTMVGASQTNSGAVRGLGKDADRVLMLARGDDADIAIRFAFENSHAGTYAIFLDESSDPFETGRFHRWRPMEAPLAIDSMAGAKLVGRRVWTTTGPVGQSHFYTFSGDGRFHDTDSDEQASGTYRYSRLDDTHARLVLQYEGPGDFTGDRHELDLRFETDCAGAFDSQYHRNDQTEIVVKGVFELLDD